jgi:hypothetical protein
MSEPIHTDEHQRLLEQAASEVARYPRHEPSHWLRTTAEAAALRLSALPGAWAPGSHPIVPLVPLWPPTAVQPAHLCARCGRSESERTPGAYRQCGMEATSAHHPGVTLRFAFELCRGCAEKEYGA